MQTIQRKKWESFDNREEKVLMQNKLNDYESIE
jgi:hypothetical protein